MNNDIKDFIKLSKYAGCRFDMIQAGGGNTSVKLNDGLMMIKASGFELSDISEETAVSKVNTREILKIFSKDFTGSKKDNDKLYSDLINQADINKSLRPSTEALMHAMLDKFVLHIHPIAVNAVLCRNNRKEVLAEIFKNEKIALMEYKTPGLESGFELKRIYGGEKIIFLQNHGLIVTADNIKEIIELTENILNKIEQYLKIDLSRYKLTSEVYEMYAAAGIIGKTPYISHDAVMLNLFQHPAGMAANREFQNILKIPPCTPDRLVYCGYKPAEIKSAEDIENYEKKYFEPPKVIIYKDKFFFIGNNLKKAKEIEDVFKADLIMLSAGRADNVHSLEQTEIEYISNWDAEKYRLNV